MKTITISRRAKSVTALLKRARSDNLKEGSRNIRRSSPLVDVRTNE